MKFDARYPDAKVNEEVRMGIIKLGVERQCWHCKEMTTFAELNYQAYLCSEECLEAVDKEYFKAMA